MADPLIDEIVEYWFGEDVKPYWFAPTPSFDRQVADMLREPYGRAAAGALDPWLGDVDGCLALCILLDQVPRNVFRGTPQAFATDEKALAVARHVIKNEFDLECTPEERLFLYLPFEHHEDLDSQRLSVRLIRERVQAPELIEWAERHLAVIERFGRFPHRNAILARESTAEEVEFLKQPGAAF
ncbi:DUF924 family protein [Azospirillum sp. TSO22-1]|uniref:DUF924 family protein n=1 Tax=Azospirillum sp. TSO22-1 TaxID=716789 RepID=UPI000D614FE0|nr:DUF924 family protein [Azospirillum sp. TSO22-1]PWC38487.1 hypothetical protein TSO221_26800 [Azospirillum sp. TSO22-1]